MTQLTLKNSLLILSTSFILAGCPEGDNPLNNEVGCPTCNYDVHEPVVLFDANNEPDVNCHRIPALITAQNGDLIAAIDERVPGCGDLKYSKDINIVLKISKDNGKTWSNTKTVVDFPYGDSASDPSLILDETTGTVFMLYNHMDLNNNKGEYNFHMVQSPDNGQTWSQPVDITPNIGKTEWKKDFKFITSGRGIQTEKGWLMHTVVNIDKGLFILVSKDHGITWELLEKPVGKKLDESKVVELDNGFLMVNSRVNNAGKRAVNFGFSDGSKWFTSRQAMKVSKKQAQQVIDPSCNASIIRYTLKSDGFERNRLLFVNPKSSTSRQNLTLRISYDEGMTWSEGKTIYAGNAAYSSLTVLKDGSIGVFYEQDGYQRNVFKRVTLEWLTDGKDTYQ